MSDPGDPHHSPSGETAAEAKEQFKECMEELLAVDTAHLPTMPPPPKRRSPQPPKLMREQVVRDLESQVRRLMNEHVFEPGVKLERVKEILADKIEEVAKQVGATGYETAQAKWLA